MKSAKDLYQSFLVASAVSYGSWLNIALVPIVTMLAYIGVIPRGGVEDTRLEAKAKDTKKVRGQGQPFRGQTLSRPRTAMLEAKAKDQGRSHKCSPKKKGLQNSFSGNHQFIAVARIFDWGGLNHKSHAITSSKICLLALNQDFAKGESLNKYS